MELTTHAREMIEKRAVQGGVKPARVIERAVTFDGVLLADVGLVLAFSEKSVRCDDGSNGHYLVAITREIEGQATIKIVFWSRDLDSERLRVDAIFVIHKGDDNVSTSNFPQ